MPRFRHILFPVDFSERSKAFRDYVRFVANQFEARLTLLNVIHVPPGTYGDLGGPLPWLMDDFPPLEEKISEMLTSYIKISAQDRIPEIQAVVQHGDAASAIVDYARQNAVDLITMPTHGHGKFRSLLLGSVTGKVLHDAECPVLTAAHTEDPAAMTRPGCKNVLAAIELNGNAADLIQQAVGLARDFNASLRIVHAVPEVAQVPPAREQLEKLQAQTGIAFEISVVPGGVMQVVRTVAVEYKADLIVLGHGRAHAAFGRFRSKSYDIIREAPCPVLSL